MVVAFYKGRKRLFNRLTSWWLKGKYSHCEIIVGVDPNGLSICVSSSMMDGGVRIKHMALDLDHWDFVEINASVSYAWMWVLENKGKGYDYLGLLGYIVRCLGHDPIKYVCSEAVAEMICMPDPWRFDPCSLYAAITRPCGHLMLDLK